MQSEASGPSAALLEAQARLLQLRASLGIEAKAAPHLLNTLAPQSEPINWLRLNAEKELARRRAQDGVRTGAPVVAPAAGELVRRSRSSRPVASPPPLAPDPQIVVVHPTLLMTLLKQQLEAPGRVYLLLRTIDHEGRGWLHVDDVRRHLTRKGSPLKILGWRRLRQLLHQGEGVFWQRDAHGRLWLKGLHRIAYTLDLGRLQGFLLSCP